MENHITPEFTMLNALAAIAIALIYICLSSLLKEPQRQHYNAVFVAGAGAAYLSGGLGSWEFVFCGLMSVMAYKGLVDYRYIGAAWLLHTGWDIVHHFYGNPIVAISPSSSAGCAVCDTILALWFFNGAPSFFDRFLPKLT